MNTLCKHYPGLPAVQQRGESVHGQAKLPWDPSQRPRPGAAEARGQPGLELQLCPGQRQHRQGSTSYLHCSDNVSTLLWKEHI